MYNGDTKEFDLNKDKEENVNEIIEIRNGEEIESLEDNFIDNKLYDEPVFTKPKKKCFLKKIKRVWENLDKKEKVIIILIAVIILLIIIVGLILIFKEPNEEEKISEVPVVLEADNYRYENGKLFFLDANGNDLGSYDCVNKDEKLCYVAYASNEDNFSVTKSVYEDNSEVFKRMAIINDDYVFVYDNEEETNGKVMLHSIKENADYESYELVKQYDLEEKYVIVNDDAGIYSLLKFNEGGYESVLDTQYNYLGIITENKEEKKYIVGVKNDKWYLIDYKDKAVTSAISYEIKNYNDSLLSVINENDEYMLYDYKNNQVLEEVYDYINFRGEYVLLVKEDKLFILDSGLNKLHEEGFGLTNKDYTQINVFNKENGELFETRNSFGLSINNNTIELTIKNRTGEEVKLINTFENKVNANYTHVNYFDGKLYIYRDTDKTELLGIYECTNKNDITSEDSELSNCYIANNSEFSDNDINYKKNEIGLLPVFNNRFAFIKDTPKLTSEETMNIVLYDLVANKKLGSYRAIDGLLFNGKTGVNFVETTGSLILAKNTKDYYGILKINLGEIVALENVKFNDKYKNIEALGSNYILQKSTGTYYMIDNKGETKTAEFSGKIMGYNNEYVKVKTNDSYQVFSYDGEEISDKFKYVELYDTVYAGVSDNKLNLYKYDKEKLFASDIELNVTTNYREGASFKVSENAGKYKVSVLNSEGNVINTFEYPESIMLPEEPNNNEEVTNEEE